MIDELDEARDTTDCINPAKANSNRLDAHKSNMDKQGYWPLLQDKEVSRLLHNPNFARLVNINPMNTINPDQDIEATCEFLISKTPGPTPTHCDPLANIHAPTGKLYGTITFKRLQILYHAFNHTQQHHPELHDEYHNPSFAQAIARLLSRYTNKHNANNRNNTKE